MRARQAAPAALLDRASAAGRIADNLIRAHNALGDAYEGNLSAAEAKAAALKQLRRARDDIATLIAEMEGG